MDPISIATMLAAKFAPGLVRRFVGDGAADAVEGFMGMASRVTGHTDPAEIEAALNRDAGMLHDFRMEAARLDNALDIAFLADVQDARARDTDRAKLGIGNTRADVLAYASLALFASLVLALIFLDIENEWARTVLGTVVGFFTKVIADVFAFEFGSSRGSKDKADQIASMTDA